MESLPFDVFYVIGSLSIVGWRLAISVSREFALWSLTEWGKKKSFSLFAKIKFQLFRGANSTVKLYVDGKYNDWKNFPAFHIETTNNKNGIRIWCRRGRLHRKDDLPAYQLKCLKIWAIDGVFSRANDRPAFVSRSITESCVITVGVWIKNGTITRGNNQPALQCAERDIGKNYLYISEYWFEGGKCVRAARTFIYGGKKKMSRPLNLAREDSVAKIIANVERFFTTTTCFGKEWTNILEKIAPATFVGGD